MSIVEKGQQTKKNDRFLHIWKSKERRRAKLQNKKKEKKKKQV